MRFLASHSWFVAACTVPIVGLGCMGERLDVGVANENDDSVEAGGSSDAGPPDADAGESPIPVGLRIDDQECVSTVSSDGWPNWRYLLDGDCGSLGHARLVLESVGTVPYPQGCSVATQMMLGMDAEGDAGTLYYEANGSKGSCTVMNGPTSEDPTTAVVVEGVLLHHYEPTRSHHVTYRQR